MNILFLIVDEMSWWARTRRDIATPHLDSLAARGVEFTQAYTPAPICVPARAAIATGRYQHQIGYWDSTMGYDGRVPGWGHALQSAGYRTLSFGKLHYRNGTDPTGFDRQILPIHVPGEGWPLGPLRQPLADYRATEGFATDVGTGWTDYTRHDAAVTAAACEILPREPEPWAAFVSWVSPHYPLIAPTQDEALYPWTPRAAEPLPDHPVLRQIGGFFDHDRHFDDRRRGEAAAAYFGLCTFVDRQIGAVLSTINLDETLVIFTSDHGEMLGEKGFWGKSVMYDSSTRIPLLLSGPGIEPGKWDAPVSLIDIAPTVTEAGGAETDGFEGCSLLNPRHDRAVISEYHDGGSSVGITMLRWETWKYVHYADGHRPQLFDLISDPDEQHDLAASLPSRVLEAQARLASFCDPEDIHRRALADQVNRIKQLGGRDALLATPQWNYTPVPSDGG